MNQDQKFTQMAIDIAEQAIQEKVGGPFGAVIVKDGKIIGQSSNKVFANFDPTAHAEVQAIRAACSNEQVHSLEGCTLYTSCEPCPMCYGAVHYAKISRVIYAAKHKDADRISGFGVDKIYKNLAASLDERQPAHVQCLGKAGESPFRLWNSLKLGEQKLKVSIQDK